jgi:hypothetical protein
VDRLPVQACQHQFQEFNMSLRANDLQDLVKKVFEIDSYQSKIGDDENVIVLTFTVDREDPAKDMENFIEMGFDFVLDADVSPGETDDGTYKVFVEIERSRHAPAQILELLDGIERLTGMPDMRFRYFKSFKSLDATHANLATVVPTDKKSYIAATKRYQEDNYENFFSTSPVNNIKVINESITFSKDWVQPVTFDIAASGTINEVYGSINGPIMIESRDISEIMFYTKYIGNYNINKIGKTFIFENNGWAVALEERNVI